MTFANAGFDSGPDEIGLVIGYWRAIGLNVSDAELVERSLYETRDHNGDIQVGNWFADRNSVVKADPNRSWAWLMTAPGRPAMRDGSMSMSITSLTMVSPKSNRRRIIRSGAFSNSGIR